MVESETRSDLPFQKNFKIAVFSSRDTESGIGTIDATYQMRERASELMIRALPLRERDRNKVVSMRRKAVKNYFTRMCEEKSGDQRKFWDTVKPFINSRKQTNPSRIILKDTGKIIKDNVKVAETLNTFFTGAGDTNGQFSNAVNHGTVEQ